MKKNKILKRQVLLYTKQLVLALSNYAEKKISKDDLINLVSDVSLANELISVSNMKFSMELAFENLMNFPLGTEGINFSIEDYTNVCKYYNLLINETVKQKYKSKKM